MQPLLRRLILFLSIAATIGIIPMRSMATHLAGSDITYQHLGGISYLVTVTIYRDCAGNTMPLALDINIHSVSCNVDFMEELELVNGTGLQITYPCPGLITSCDDPSSTNPGIQEWSYADTIDINLNCFDWVISWQFCCRNCDITTIDLPQPCVPGSNPSMYIAATLDNSIPGNFNSSPYFTNNPIVFVCVGQNLTYNHGAADPDGDSLVYSFVDPLDSANLPLVYNPGYSATNPIMSTPQITINPANGDIVMTPTQQEVGVLSVRVEEYRDGIKIGEVVRDMEIYVKTCTNNIPSATGMNGTSDRDTTICPGTALCFDIFTNDIDPGDNLTLTWNQQIPNATFVTTGSPYPTGEFCWTPGVNDISTLPHQFTVTVVDNACPNSGYQSYAFNITVNSPLVTIDATNISCNGLTDGVMAVLPVFPGNYSYVWAPNGETTSSITNLGPGSYSVTVFDSSNGCSATFTDTIIDPPSLNVTASTVSNTCVNGSNGITSASASGGTPGYSYSWNTNPVTLNDTAIDLTAGTYTITVTDSRGCTATDSAVIDTSSPALSLNIVQASNLPCNYDTTGTITVQVLSGTPGYTYAWNTNPVQTDSIATGLSPGSYTVTVTDTTGCSNSISGSVTSPPPIYSEGAVVAENCNEINGSAYIDSLSGGMPGYMFDWNGFTNNTDSLFGIPSGAYTVIITDINDCRDTLDFVVPDSANDCELELPSGFSPNGDGYNDGYYIRGIGGYPDNIFTVFNRWGNIVYSKDDYVNTDWTGQDNDGEKLPEGTYFVILEIVGRDIRKNTFVDLRRYAGDH